MVVRHNYTRNPQRARAGLRYYQMRPRAEGEPPRSIFTQEGSVARDVALRMMQEHQPKRAFLVHRIVLAPSDDERPEDLQEMTRSVMRELEKDRGERLHWVAVEHRHTEHHHVHVLLFGGTETQDGMREVRLGRQDHSRLRAEGTEYCRWEREELQGWDVAFERPTPRSLDVEGDAVPASDSINEEPQPQTARHERGAYGPER